MGNVRVPRGSVPAHLQDSCSREVGGHCKGGREVPLVFLQVGEHERVLAEQEQQRRQHEDGLRGPAWGEWRRE